MFLGVIISNAELLLLLAWTRYCS